MDDPEACRAVDSGKLFNDVCPVRRVKSGTGSFVKRATYVNTN